MQTHEYSTLIPQIQDIATYKTNSLKQLLVGASRLAQILPWYTAMAGYHTSSNNSNSQQQLTAGYRQNKQIATGCESAKKSDTV